MSMVVRTVREKRLNISLKFSLVNSGWCEKALQKSTCRSLRKKSAENDDLSL